MTNVRRLVLVAGFLGLTIFISTTLQGQSGSKTAGTGTGTAPQLTPGKPAIYADGSESRFANPAVITYRPIKGDSYFALQVKPKLEATPVRSRDIVVMLSSTATQGGPSWVASHQIAEGILENARDGDRISLWTVNAPENTKNLLTKDFVSPKDYADGKRLRDALAKFRTTEYPSGTASLPNALEKIIKSFDLSKDRQRIILFLGDGLSAHTPMDEKQQNAFAAQMVDRRITFFTVPLGLRFNSTTLHGLANSTGGVVLRTRVEREKMTDVLKRFEEAFAGSVLYGAKLRLPAEMTEVIPTSLPPLRGDQPTLVVGRMTKVVKHIEYTVTGTIAGRTGLTTIPVKENVLAHSLDNYFLVNMVDQWSKAKNYPAIYRADRALMLAYEQTRLDHGEALLAGDMALGENKLDAAARHYQQARQLAPHDAQAAAGLKIVERLKDGSLTREMVRKELAKPRKVDRLEIVDGKERWVRVDFSPVIQPDPKVPDGGKKVPDVDLKPGIAPENLIKEHRDRQMLEEQKVTQLVDDVIHQVNRNLKADGRGSLESLRNLVNRVKDHPDLGAHVRQQLSARLETAYRNAAAQVQADELRRKDLADIAAVAAKTQVREQDRKSFEDRIASQFAIFRNQMTKARFDETTKRMIVDAMVDMQIEAREKGYRVPIASKAMYDVALAANPLQTHHELIREREQSWLTAMMGIEKPHVPYPDESGIRFPPLKKWKKMSEERKIKYSSLNFPSTDYEGGKAAQDVLDTLKVNIETSGYTEKKKLKAVLNVLSKSASAKAGKKLSILVDAGAFAAGKDAAAIDPLAIYETEVALPEEPDTLSVGTALEIIASQIDKEGTYIINRDHVLITTHTFVKEVAKVQRIHPVADLFDMPFMKSKGFNMAFNNGGGMGMGGMGGMGMMGMGGGGMGMMGMGGGGMGMMGMGGGGSDVMQAFGLMKAITDSVAPGTWYLGQLTPAGMMMGMMMGMGFPGGGMMMGFPGGGMMMGFPGGMMMMGGFPGGMMMVGMPPADPTLDPTLAAKKNTINYFPAALAIVVHAPARVHTTRISVVGSRPKDAGAPGTFLVPDGKGGAVLAALKKDPKIRVGPAKEGDDPKLARGPDPTKVWNEILSQGGIDAGHVIATADFLFECCEFRHAAEFLKANLRQGIVVRPWVYECLAVAIEMSGGDQAEADRARLSGIALDPADAQGYLSAAKAVASRGQNDRAIAFCKQAALLDPSDFRSFEVALAYAETAKDAAAMEWAVGSLLAQDWPSDNTALHQSAKKRLASLKTTLKSENRAEEANRLEEALKRLYQRDLVIELKWENSNGPCELEMKVSEPPGTICNLEQNQSSGGGVMMGYDLISKEPNCQYVAAQGFSGEYVVKISRLYGQPLGNRARLVVTQNAGTPQKSSRIMIVDLNQNVPIKINLKDGRRTELATITQTAQRREKAQSVIQASAVDQLRAIASPNYFGGLAGPRGGVGQAGQAPSVSAMASKDPMAKLGAMVQNTVNTGNGVQLTTEMRLSADQRGYEMVIRPFFDAGGRANRSASNLSMVPGGGN